jgi:[protein-PII] uridylyltransferase
MLNVPAPVPSPAPAGFAEIFDAAAVAAELEQLQALHSGNERELRTAVAQKLKAALTRGRAVVERMLLRDRRGRLCAERLCFMQDEIIRILFEFAQRHLYPADNPSEAERMAIVATGGYGRGILAPGSDIDLLFLLPYKEPHGAIHRRSDPLCMWDMGLKVGHATRSVNECIRQSKADMTIEPRSRGALPLAAQLFDG